MAIDTMLTTLPYDPLPPQYNRGNVAVEDNHNRETFLKTIQDKGGKVTPEDLGYQLNQTKKTPTEGDAPAKLTPSALVKNIKEDSLKAPITLHMNGDQNLLEGIEQLYPGGFEEFFSHTWVGLQDGEMPEQIPFMVNNDQDTLLVKENFEVKLEALDKPILLKNVEEAPTQPSDTWFFEEVAATHPIRLTTDETTPAPDSLSLDGEDEITLSSYGNILIEGFDGENTDFEKFKMAQNLLQTLPPFVEKEAKVTTPLPTIMVEGKVEKSASKAMLSKTVTEDDGMVLKTTPLQAITTENKPETGMFDGKMDDPFFQLKSPLNRDNTTPSDENLNPFLNTSIEEIQGSELSHGTQTTTIMENTSVKSDPVALALADTVKSHPLFFAHRGQQVQTPAPQSQHLFIEVRKALDEGQDKITVKLSPVSLGKVDIKIEVGADGRSTAIIATERPETLDLFRKDATYLQNSLSEMGLELDLSNSSFNLMNPYENKNNEQAQNSNKGPGSKTQEDIGDALGQDTSIYQRVSSHNGLYHEFA